MEPRPRGGTVKLADPHPDGNDAYGDDGDGLRCRCAQRRVAVELSEDGKFTWRFVPDARRALGVEDEGSWPRVVDFCGENVELTCDEWDMYKLDGAYDCLVRPPPLLTLITPAASSSTSSTTPQESLKPPQLSKGKRRLSTSPSLRPHSIDDRDTPTTGVQKKFKTVDLSDGWSSSPSSTYGDDDEEVEKMVVDGVHLGQRVTGNGHGFAFGNMNGNGKMYLKSERLRKVRANKEEARRLRKEWTERWRQRRAASGHAKTTTTADDIDELDDLDGLPGAFDDTDTNTPPPIFSTPAPPNTAKRKAQTPSSSTPRSSSHPPESDLSDSETYTAAKRTRTLSPGAVHRAMEVKRKEREKRRKEEMDRRWRERAEVRRGVLMDEVLRDVPLTAHASVPTEAENFNRDEPNHGENGATHEHDTGTGTAEREDEDEDAAHRAAIEESRRKIAELEKDRPLWEEQARRRRAQEAAEAARAAEAKARRGKAAANLASASTASSSKHTGPPQQKHKEKEQTPAQGPSLAQKRARLRAELRAEEQKACTSGRWTPARALDRYLSLSSRFDSLSFTPTTDPCIFELVPWPVFSPPGSLAVEDITWSRVEDFFARVREALRKEFGRGGGEEMYRKVVGESHRRFHPDRWRARNVLVGVEDEEERECLEGAANTVAQALTPLWKEATGR